MTRTGGPPKHYPDKALLQLIAQRVDCAREVVWHVRLALYAPTHDPTRRREQQAAQLHFGTVLDALSRVAEEEYFVALFKAAEPSQRLDRLLIARRVARARYEIVSSDGNVSSPEGCRPDFHQAPAAKSRSEEILALSAVPLRIEYLCALLQLDLTSIRRLLTQQ